MPRRRRRPRESREPFLLVAGCYSAGKIRVASWLLPMVAATNTVSAHCETQEGAEEGVLGLAMRSWDFGAVGLPLLCLVVSSRSTSSASLPCGQCAPLPAHSPLVSATLAHTCRVLVVLGLLREASQLLAPH